jgi:hypothetical protein
MYDNFTLLGLCFKVYCSYLSQFFNDQSTLFWAATPFQTIQNSKTKPWADNQMHGIVITLSVSNLNLKIGC